ncbi:MAG: hypothetical protein ACRDT6_27195, partial [Micromonosporaceae bacterium]
MAEARRGAERVTLPRRFPSSAIGRIVGYLVVSGIVVAALWLLFGEEPRRLPNEMINPMAYLPHLAAVVSGIGLLPVIMAVFRRPLITVDSYSLTLRSGILRTLVLPWARISDVAVYKVTLQDDPEPLLLVRCVERHGKLGDTPRWWDQRVLRAAAKAAGGAVGGYDMAVKFADFHGSYRDHLRAIGGFAPDRVSVVDRTTGDGKPGSRPDSTDGPGSEPGRRSRPDSAEDAGDPYGPDPYGADPYGADPYG